VKGEEESAEIYAAPSEAVEVLVTAVEWDIFGASPGRAPGERTLMLNLSVKAIIGDVTALSVGNETAMTGSELHILLNEF
jgi:hypothetical protein